MHDATDCRCMSKEPYISTDKPYISAKEPYISTKEPCISAKEPYILFVHKRAHVL